MATEIAHVPQLTLPAPLEVAAATTETIIENRIFVGGLPSSANEAELRTFLTERFFPAQIRDVKIISDRSGVSKGYGFVTFETREMVQWILSCSEFENMVFKDRKLNISKAVKKHSTARNDALQNQVPHLLQPQLLHQHLQQHQSPHHNNHPQHQEQQQQSQQQQPLHRNAPAVQYLLYTGGQDMSCSQPLITLPIGYSPTVYLQQSPYTVPAIPLASAAQMLASCSNSSASSSTTITHSNSNNSSIAWPTAAAAAAGQHVQLVQHGDVLYYQLPNLYAAQSAAATSATNSELSSNGSSQEMHHAEHETDTSPIQMRVADSSTSSNLFAFSPTVGSKTLVHSLSNICRHLDGCNDLITRGPCN